MKKFFTILIAALFLLMPIANVLAEVEVEPIGIQSKPKDYKWIVRLSHDFLFESVNPQTVKIYRKVVSGQ